MIKLKNQVKYKFGGKIRAVRERKNITLKAVALRAGVSESLVSQIERNKVSPSIDTLLTLADALDIDYEYLFNDYRQKKKVSIVRFEERNSLKLNDVTVYQLSKTASIPEEHAIEAFMLEIEQGSEKGDLEYGHSGKEFGLILEGEAELIYGAEKYLLKAGDTVSFLSDIPHILRNSGEGQVRAVWVVTPPRPIFKS